jgi:hypothetical protein
VNWLRRLVLSGLRRVERRYQRTHRLQPVGPILYMARSPYHGPVMQFADDTLLEAGDDVGLLHFNNERFTRIEAASSTSAALGFLRLMLESMQSLSDKARHDPEFSDLAVFHAVSWLPAHGHRVGFITAPFPDGPRKRVITAYFRLLIWAFAPVPKSRISTRPDPHYYWLTRKELLRRFPESGRDRKQNGGRRLEHAGARSR